MIYTEEVFQLEDKVNELIDILAASTLIENLTAAKESFCCDQKALAKQKAFLFAKAAYEKVEAYAAFAPDYKEKRLALSKAKRSLDLDGKVAEIRRCETDLQQVLDAVSVALSNAVSEDIKVDTGNPFFQTGRTKSGCSGNCQLH